MPVQNLHRWRNEVIARLEDLQVIANQYRQYMVAHELNVWEEMDEFTSQLQQITDLFPDDFHPNRFVDLRRHLSFAQTRDFGDIVELDIPAIIDSVQRYGRQGAEFINAELERFNYTSTLSNFIHPRIREATTNLIEQRNYSDAARVSVCLIMDELRRLSGEANDGDPLIRSVVRTNIGSIAFSNCRTNNSKAITEGFKQITQGLYKGVRNTTAHGETPFGRSEAFQIMTICSLLLSNLQIVAGDD
jgi:uncharacterized protein (TIGR02391 family)